MSLPTLSDYYDRLARHDWTYSYSDDPGVYRSGSAEESALRAIAERSPAHQHLFNAYRLYTWGDGGKPERPAEVVT